MGTAEISTTSRVGSKFVLLWTGQLGSMLGTMTQFIAVPVWILSVTGSPVTAGLAFAVETLPVVLLAPWAGLIVDRFPRRRVVVLCETASVAVVLGMIIAASATSIIGVMIGAVLVKSFNAISVPALQALMREVVEPDAMPRAVAYFDGLTGATAVLGPPLGTFLFAYAGVHTALLINAVSFVMGALCTAFIRHNALPPAVGPRPRLLDGVRLIRANATLGRLISAEASYFLCFGGVSAVALVITVWELGEARAGWYLGSLGLAWVAVSWGLLSRRQWLPRFALRAGALFLLPAAIALTAVPIWPVGMVVLAGVLSGTANSMIAAGATLGWQRHVAVESIGQVMALRRSFMNAALSASSALLPMLTVWTSVPITLVAAAVVGSVAIVALTR